QVFLELVDRGEQAAARELEGAVARHADEVLTTGQDADLTAPVAFALGLVRLEAGDPQAAASRFAAARAAARGAAPGTAAAAVAREARRLEAEALSRAGCRDRAAAEDGQAVGLAASPVPPAIAARARRRDPIGADAAAAPRVAVVLPVFNG